MSNITKQSEFSQRKYNEAKMGAYYTDIEHCRMLAKFFEFPEEEEVCCLEPSIGNGAAILAVTEKEKGGKENLKIFGVELNEDTYADVSQNVNIDYCVKADFLVDVTITQQAFSFCFMNPPYAKLWDGNRYELAFLQKTTPYLSKGGVTVMVVPIYTAHMPEFASEWCTAYDTLHVYRFHEKVYAQFRQIVLIGRKKEKPGTDAETVEWLVNLTEDCDKMETIPYDYDGERIVVGKSLESGVTEFMPREFREADAKKFLSHSPLNNLVRDRTAVPPYLIDNLGRPPILPSEGHMYLLAVSGAGQGLVGSVENKDLHPHPCPLSRTKA